MRTALVCMCFSLCLLSLAAADEQRKQSGHSVLFVDDLHISHKNSVKRTLQQPLKQVAPVITSQGKWDSSPYLFGTVIFDEQHQIYKAWYMSYNDGQPLPVRTPFLYATSNDGREWNYPDLGLYEYEGSKQNNIILQNAGYHDSYSPSVVKDLNEVDAARRYKMIFWDFSAHGSYNGNEGMMVAFSPDGIHWKRWQEKPLLSAAKHEQSISDVMDLMIDPTDGKYVAYTKGWADPFPHHRQVVRTESTDFLNWSAPQVVLRHANTIDDAESYGMPVFVHEGIYFGLLRSYHSKTDKTIDIRLTSSRDGRAWHRVASQASFMPTGSADAWDRGMLFSTAPVIRNDVMEFYYGAWDGNHDSRTRTSAIGLATLPLHRFVAVEAYGSVGRLETTPQRICQDSLTLNANVRTGCIRVSLRNADGQALPGFSFDDCDAIDGDRIRHRLSWNGNSDLTSFVGQDVTLQFQLTGNAQLFAFCNSTKGDD